MNNHAILFLDDGDEGEEYDGDEGEEYNEEYDANEDYFTYYGEEW